MTDLFANRDGRLAPLAERMRPESLDEVVGQGDLLAVGRPLRARIEADRIGCICLWGPTGTGKTTLARILARSTNRQPRMFIGTRIRSEDVRKIEVDCARERLVVFVDEIHRATAPLQDSLLDLAERRVIDLVVATTENPAHVMTKGLNSRFVVYAMQPIAEDDLVGLAERAAVRSTADGEPVRLGPGAALEIARRAGGDVRRAMNAVEDLALLMRSRGGKVALPGDVEDVFGALSQFGDRSGDVHYDFISAFIKSMRGSDPDATLYYLARIAEAGEDPRYIARRIMIHASEDVGLADNGALQTAVAAAQAVEMVGWPEASIILAHAALHVARAPKSASASRGIGLALARVKQGGPIPVPMYLRDAHYADAAKLGHEGYEFPHDDPRGWVEQDYAPGIRRGSLYQSDARGNATWEARADVHWSKVTGEAPVRRFPD